ncbi:site-specific integrase [Nubsella zeaxanthinifaciens]|uniref:site-specific integrase n=1 Tax=Nubsella zeaxanthinifaciens TaxID=392412 RepID=UPI000DE29335|nr:site-specific integrase [Nubsella zeaxanthinifaciens]
MITNVNLLFYLKKRNAKTKGPIKIYLRFTVEGQRAEISTNKSCTAEKWDTKEGRMLGSREEARTINSQLDRMQTKAEELYRLMALNEELLTAETLKNRFLGKVEKARTLIAVFTDHNDKMRSLLGQEYEKSTLGRYETCLSHVKDFMKSRYGISDIPVSKISYTFLEDFDYYLRSVRKNGNNCTIKYLKNLGKVIRICLGNGWLTVDPYINYKPKAKQVDRQVVNLEELDRLKAKEFTIERLAVVRDVFVFCCYTGLAYADVFKLKREELVEGADGNRWIFTHRKKTDTLSRIPVLPAAMEIIEKYHDDVRCQVANSLLPVMSNQKMNAYLKEIAILCQIEKPLTFHIARHTFATTVTLNNGVPIESVSKMLGHTSIKTTQIYAKVMDQKIGADMERLKMKLA